MAQEPFSIINRLPTNPQSRVMGCDTLSKPIDTKSILLARMLPLTWISAAPATETPTRDHPATHTDGKLYDSRC